MTRLTTSENVQVPGSLRSDGQTLAFVEVHQDANYDIALLDITTGRVTPLMNSRYIEMCAEFSPDGRWIAYASNKSGRVEVYVQGFPNLGTLYQVSSEGGFEPAWARDGKQMFYRWGEEIGNKMPSQMWVVDVRTDSGFTTSKPRLVFERSGYNYSAPGRDYDLSLDSRRFLMVKNEERKPAPVTEMILVLNWFEELKRLVPTGR